VFVDVDGNRSSSLLLLRTCVIMPALQALSDAACCYRCPHVAWSVCLRVCRGGGQYASSCQISSKSVKLLQRYGELTVFSMAAVRHLGFVVRYPDVLSFTVTGKLIFLPGTQGPRTRVPWTLPAPLVRRWWLYSSTLSSSWLQ